MRNCIPLFDVDVIAYSCLNPYAGQANLKNLKVDQKDFQAVERQNLVYGILERHLNI